MLLRAAEKCWRLSEFEPGWRLIRARLEKKERNCSLSALRPTRLSRGKPKRARPGAHVHGTCQAVSEKQGRPREIRAVTVGAKIWIAALTMELGAAQGDMVGPSLARPGAHRNETGLKPTNAGNVSARTCCWLR